MPLLAGLPNVVLARLGDVLETELFTQGEHIVREGTAGDTFYILASGEVRVTIRGETVRQMGQGEYFGEQVQCTQGLYDRDFIFAGLAKNRSENCQRDGHHRDSGVPRPRQRVN